MAVGQRRRRILGVDDRSDPTGPLVVSLYVCDVCGGALHGGGYELVPTFDVPHFDVPLPAASAEAAGSLLSLFGDPHRTPYKRRRR